MAFSPSSYGQVLPDSRPCESVEALQVIFPPSKVFFRNSRGRLVVKGCSSIFLSFLFSLEQTFKHSLSQSRCLTPCLQLKALNIYRSFRIPSLKFRVKCYFYLVAIYLVEDSPIMVNTLDSNFSNCNYNIFYFRKWIIAQIRK